MCARGLSEEGTSDHYSCDVLSSMLPGHVLIVLVIFYCVLGMFYVKFTLGAWSACRHVRHVSPSLRKFAIIFNILSAFQLYSLVDTFLFISPD